MATTPIIIMETLTIVHAGSTTSLSMHEISPKRVHTYVSLTTSVSTETLATTKTLSAASSLTLAASPCVGSTAISAIIPTTRLETSTPMIETTTPQIEVLAICTIHRDASLPPMYCQRPSLGPFFTWTLAICGTRVQ
jgi:hypothetical protein